MIGSNMIEDLEGDFVERLHEENIARLELLLQRHADFDDYVRERGE